MSSVKLEAAPLCLGMSWRIFGEHLESMERSSQTGQKLTRLFQHRPHLDTCGLYAIPDGHSHGQVVDIRRVF